jgi:hypothetical protein
MKLLKKIVLSGIVSVLFVFLLKVSPAFASCTSQPTSGLCTGANGMGTNVCTLTSTGQKECCTQSTTECNSAGTPATTNTSTPTWYNQSFQEWYGKVYDPSNPNEIFGERYTAAQVQWIVYGLFSFLVNSATGPQNTGLIQCFISNAANITTCATQLTKLLTDSNIQGQTVVAEKTSPKQSLLSLVFATDRPMSGISYVKERLQRFSLVPIAHAQTAGFGFTTALEPIQNMWKVFRDIAFGLFVIVAIVFAFMIMFRVKLSPQTVISVQSALPKIIFALILVTFSYAIAGFLIDFMYIVIGFLSSILAPLVPQVFLLQTHTYTAPDMFTLLTSGGFGGSAGGGIINLLSAYLMPLILIFVIIGVIGLIASETGIGAIVAVISIVALLAVIIVGLWISLKTIWALFKAFANILLLTIFAPIQLALGPLVPSLSFGAWLKSYLSNLSVFVVTGVLWVFAWIFSIDAWKSIIPNNSIILPAASTASWPPLLGSSGTGVTLLFAGVSFVLFTLMPKANEVIQGLITGKPFAYGTAVGEAIGPVVAVGQFGIGNINARRELPRETAAKRANAGYAPDTLTQLLRALKLTKQ